MKSCLKHLLLVFLAVAAFGLFTPAQAQTQITSFEEHEDFTGNPLPCGDRDRIKKDLVFTDFYDQVSGTHSGS
ncbi:MAG TPA: hypothetical protein VGB98_21925, partial [Pyrinomonadaceae bacterium]